MDLLRGIGIIFVVLIHITNFYLNGNSLDNFTGVFVNQLSRVAVPIFLILSGLGLTMSHKLKNGYFKFLINQVWKIIPMYLIWSVVYYFYQFILFGDESFNAIKLLTRVLLGTNRTHLYYVPITVALYIIYPLLYYLAIRKFGLLIALLITLISQGVYFITGIELLNIEQNIFSWLFYFVFGIWLAIDFDNKLSIIKQNQKKISLILIISALIVVTESVVSEVSTSLRPSVILYSIAFFTFVLSFNVKNSKFQNIIIKLGNFSYGIYLIHPLVLDGYRLFAGYLSFGSIPLFYISLGLVVVMIISTNITRFFIKPIL